MGGISGYFQFDQSQNKAVLHEENLRKSLEYINHRGPDSSGIYISPCGRSGLGHVRLSVNDLAHGQQPLSSQEGDIHVVVNGEFYDYKRIRSELQAKGYEFKTESDSEIALCLYQEYGLSFLDHLRGEFAICIWDASKCRFIVAKDRFGVKPLYFTMVKGALLVASEIKAFLPMDWTPEWDVDSLLNNGVMFDFRTAFKGVNKLPPAHYMVATSTGNIQIRPYWCQKYAKKAVKETRSVDSMIQGVRERLVEAVKQRLVADVPVGIYLGDDIDSACIAGIVSQVKREDQSSEKIKAFSLSFVGDDDSNESSVAERTAEFCNVDFEALKVTEDDLLNNFEESIWHVEQPHFNLEGVAKFMLSKMVQDQGFKIVLSSEGADEHFAGYTHYQPDYLREPDYTSPNGFGTLSDQERVKKLEILGAQQASRKKTQEQGYAGNKNVVHKMVNNTSGPTLLESSYTLTSTFFSKAAIAKYGSPNPALAIAEALNGISRNNAASKWHPIHTAMSVQCTTFLPNWVLSSLGDRAEMAHSIEARPPFLDHNLCDYVNGLPPSVKIKADHDGNLVDKWILKEAAKPYVIEEAYNSTKGACSMVPPPKSPNSTFLALLDKHITKEKIERLGWIDYEVVKTAKDSYCENNDLRTYQDLLIVMSYVVISERFNVATSTFEKVTFPKHQFSEKMPSKLPAKAVSSLLKKAAISMVVIAPIVYSSFFL
ncbi:hypothetical protein [Parasitella parasitica]|uniref:Glutamine amidotransferase type-2 domain-containing protein n=1 Tax=Parasitella parasitica TaxID=35722 RepID=A0A0B7NIX9_9FUNG|nr:hypothetical protein [Parasitella parasitica]